MSVKPKPIRIIPEILLMIWMLWGVSLDLIFPANKTLAISVAKTNAKQIKNTVTIYLKGCNWVDACAWIFAVAANQNINTAGLSKFIK